MSGDGRVAAAAVARVMPAPAVPAGRVGSEEPPTPPRCNAEAAAAARAAAARRAGAMPSVAVTQRAVSSASVVAASPSWATIAGPPSPLS